MIDVLSNIFSKISRNALSLSLVSFFMNFSTSIIISSMFNLWFKAGKIEEGMTALTFSKSLADAAGYFVRFLLGYISDKIANNKLFLLMGYGAGVITKILFLLSTTDLLDKKLLYMIFLISNVVDEFFNKIRDTPRDVLLSASIKNPENIKTNFAFRSFLSFCGSFSGALFAFFYLKKYTNQFFPLFLISLGFTLVAFLILVLRVENINNPITKQNIEEKKNSTWDIKFNTKFVVFLLGLFFLFLGKTNNTSINEKAAFNNIKINNQVLNMIYYVGSAACALILSLFSLNISNSFIISVTFLCLTNAFLFYMKNSLVLYGACFVYGLSNGIINSFIVPALLEYFPNVKGKGALIGFSYLLIGIATISQGIIFKKISENFTISSAIISSVAILILALIIFVLFSIFIGTKKQKESQDISLKK